MTSAGRAGYFAAARSLKIYEMNQEELAKDWGEEASNFFVQIQVAQVKGEDAEKSVAGQIQELEDRIEQLKAMGRRIESLFHREETSRPQPQKQFTQPLGSHLTKTAAKKAARKNRTKASNNHGEKPIEVAQPAEVK